MARLLAEDLDLIAKRWSNEGIVTRQEAEIMASEIRALWVDVKGLEAMLKKIAVQGGPAHWTHEYIDGRFGEGTCRRWCDEDQARIERENEEFSVYPKKAE